MAEIPEVIRKLHARYEKLMPSRHDWEKHRTLVIDIKGFHCVAVNFKNPGLIVGHKYRNKGPMEETPETKFPGDDSELFWRLVKFIESEVPERQWERIYPPAPKEVLTVEDYKFIDDILKNNGE